MTSVRSVAGLDTARSGAAADRAPLRNSAAGSLPAGQVQVLPAVAVAVEDGHAAADEELELAVVGVLEPGVAASSTKCGAAAGGGPEAPSPAAPRIAAPATRTPDRATRRPRPAAIHPTAPAARQRWLALGPPPGRSAR